MLHLGVWKENVKLRLSLANLAALDLGLHIA